MGIHNGLEQRSDPDCWEEFDWGDLEFLHGLAILIDLLAILNGNTLGAYVGVAGGTKSRLKIHT